MTYCPRLTNGRHKSSPRTDRGEATTQMVILTPILLVLVLLGVQAAVYFHAANVAMAAASQAAATASSPAAVAGDGVAVAQRTIDDLGGHPVHVPTVNISDGYVSVSVQVVVSRIVPFFPGSVTRTVLEPRERFVPESNR